MRPRAWPRVHRYGRARRESRTPPTTSKARTRTTFDDGVGGRRRTCLLLGIVLAAHNLTTLLRWARTNSWTLDPLTRIVIPDNDDIFDPDSGTGASAPAQPGAPPLAGLSRHPAAPHTRTTPPPNSPQANA